MSKSNRSWLDIWKEDLIGGEYYGQMDQYLKKINPAHCPWEFIFYASDPGKSDLIFTADSSMATYQKLVEERAEKKDLKPYLVILAREGDEGHRNKRHLEDTHFISEQVGRALDEHFDKGYSSSTEVFINEVWRGNVHSYVMDLRKPSPAIFTMNPAKVIKVRVDLSEKFRDKFYASLVKIKTEADKLQISDPKAAQVATELYSELYKLADDYYGHQLSYVMRISDDEQISGNQLASIVAKQQLKNFFILIVNESNDLCIAHVENGNIIEHQKTFIKNTDEKSQTILSQLKTMPATGECRAFIAEEHIRLQKALPDILSYGTYDISGQGKVEEFAQQCREAIDKARPKLEGYSKLTRILLTLIIILATGILPGIIFAGLRYGYTACFTEKGKFLFFSQERVMDHADEASKMSNKAERVTKPRTSKNQFKKGK